MSELFTSFDLTLVLGFIVTFMALNFTPGPAVLKVVSDAVSNGVGPAHASMAGVFAANFMYAILAAAGMSALLLAFPLIFETVKWIGVAYLVWLAFNTFKTIFTLNGAAAKPVEKRTPKALFWSSFAIQGANPKSVLSFGIMLPVFAGSGEGIEMRMMLLALLNMVLEYPALLFYAVVGSSVSKFAVSTFSRRMLSFVSGCGLAFAAFMIARTSIQPR
jgi:homoserine/homoserine lactone efflux protein